MTPRFRTTSLVVVGAFHFIGLLTGLLLTLSIFFAVLGVPLVLLCGWAISHCYRLARTGDRPQPGFLRLITIEIVVVIMATAALVALAGLGPSNNKLSLLAVVIVLAAVVAARVQLRHQVSELSADGDGPGRVRQ